MRTVEIRSPIWDGMKVGIASYKLDHGEVAVEITYTTKQGERLYPETFLLTRQEAQQYPTQTIRGTKLYIIPIRCLRVK